MDDQRRLLALCAIRIEGRSIDWSLLAREAQLWQGLDRLEAGRFHEDSKDAQDGLPLLVQGLKRIDEARARVDQELAIAERVGARLVTVLDDEYPATLRAIFNLPPFLFEKGALLRNDTVGRRAGHRRIGTRARHRHRGSRCRARRPGRGDRDPRPGIATAIFPAANRDLAERIRGSGALVSQFWPSAHKASWTFPRRNVVTSGISQGTVVVEASSTSGAKMQARLAIQHGKRVWLLRSLVESQDWAQSYVARRGAIAVDTVEDVIADLVSADRIRDAARQRQQLALDVL